MRSSSNSAVVVPQPKSIPATEWLDTLHTIAASCKEDLQADAVHDLRVAAGRLRIWLALSGTRVLQDDLKWLRDAAGPLRDLDVVIERLGSRPWAKDCFARRDLLAEELVATLAGARARGLLAALRVFPPLPVKKARKGAEDLKKDVLKVGGRVHCDGDDYEPIHRLRRSVRKLRYAVECRGGKSTRLEALQEALGEIGDLSTAHKYAVEAGDVDGARGDRAEIEGDLAKHRERCFTAWKRARRDVEDL